RQQTSLLGALPSAAALRATQGAVYATTSGLANGITGQIFYGGSGGTIEFNEASALFIVTTEEDGDVVD
ncbi:unnamed protein product, partial [Rotaria sp. Silwood2]